MSVTTTSINLTDRLAQMNTTIQSPIREMTYETAWIIEHFHRLADAFSWNEVLAAKQLTIPLPGSPRETAHLSLSCLLNDNEDNRVRGGGLHIRMTATLRMSHAGTAWKTTLSIGLLNKDGVELFPRDFTARNGCSNEISLKLGRLQVLGDREGILHPNGRLVIIAKVTFFTWSPEIVSEKRPLMAPKQLAEGAVAARLHHQNLNMLDNFVDLGAASVLLVFQDGEQLCHTFPLAARQGQFKNWLMF
jgi:hypothetical protein